MTFVIRNAEVADLPALLALEQQAFTGDRFTARQFRHLLLRARSDFRVATRDDRLLGYAVSLYRRGATRARLYGVAVAEAARGQGVASALILALAAAARDRGYLRMGLEVRTDNAGAQQLYRKLGFAAENCIDSYYEDGASAQRMVLRLDR